MSYTQNQHVYGAFSEDGFNTILSALFETRPRYFNYGTPVFAPQDSVTITQLPAGPYGLQYRVAFDLPDVDITPPNDTTSPLPPGNNQLTLATAITVSVHSGTATPSCKLGLYLRCSPSPGGTATTFTVADVKITGISPPALEAVLEAIVKAFAQQLLSSFRIPVGAFAFPPVTLVLQSGPIAQNDSIEVRGDLI